jgi:hypothetical protein
MPLEAILGILRYNLPSNRAKMAYLGVFGRYRGIFWRLKWNYIRIKR